MGKWDKERHNLEEYIYNGISYEEIGRKYNCTGGNIKKQAKKLGIILPQKRKISDKETFNKGKRSKVCIICGNSILRGSVCSRECSNKLKNINKIKEWKNGKNFIKGTSEVPKFIKEYLFEKYNNQCQICGWDKVNPITGKIPLQIHHIDGDCTNNKEENLQLLCPNCHSLTETFGSLNKNSKRFYHKKITKKELQDIN